MAQPKLTLYFDLHSPYSYLAFYALRYFKDFETCTIEYVPVLLIGFVKQMGGTPPWSNPNKVSYLHKDLARCAAEADIPWAPGLPAKYPDTSTVKVQRAIAACTTECPDRAAEAIDALYHAFWVQKKAVQLPDVYGPILADIVGSGSADKIDTAAQTFEVKELLRRNTARALDSGAPGLPWIVATRTNGGWEGFWGFDHLTQVARFLGLGIVPSPHL